MPILISIVLFLMIVAIACANVLDKWRFRADRQYPYVRELIAEWETQARQELAAAGIPAPEGRAADCRHVWDAVAAANRLYALCPAPGPERAELEEELATFRDVYNGLVRSYRKSLGRPVVRQMARLFKWQRWEEMTFPPQPEPDRVKNEF